MTCRSQIADWLSAQPDLQFVIDPHFSRENAVTFGLLIVTEILAN